ncbi:DUF3493 domain-containing protein [Synechococcus elongatus]|uniref:DUF3493 domain-containing protein n=1 Tax=Synechococcus elongatus TaxID=32046 RepID=UPI0030CE4253
MPQLDPEQRARLQAEVAAPYRGLRRTFYGVFAASGAIGAFIFLLKAIAGESLATTLPNLALQIGVVALMIGLLRLERTKS